MPLQPDLQFLSVRIIRPDEESRWNELMKTHHYLGFRQLVGESINSKSCFKGSVHKREKAFLRLADDLWSSDCIGGNVCRPFAF
jgi:hypothetical protein